MPSRAFQQVAALPIRAGLNGAIEVLLVTSRETGRWVVPKGWPMPGKTDWDAAATEALEEAGVTGTVDPNPIGHFTYFKRRRTHFDLIDVTVYLVTDVVQRAEWRERMERKSCWFRASEAAEQVWEPGLTQLLLGLKPEALALNQIRIAVASAKKP